MPFVSLAQLGNTHAKLSQRLLAHAIVKCLPLLLSGDIILNLGLINFGLVNWLSFRNRGPLFGGTIVSNNLDILVLGQTDIQNSDTDSLLKSLPGFQITHGTWMTGCGGAVIFLNMEDLPAKTFDAPT